MTPYVDFDVEPIIYDFDNLINKRLAHYTFVRYTYNIIIIGLAL